MAELSPDGAQPRCSLGLHTGLLTAEDYAELLQYSTSVELFDSGQSAVKHGLATDSSLEIVELRRKLDAKLHQKLAQTGD